MAGERRSIDKLDRSVQRTIDEHREELMKAIARLEDRIVAKFKALKEKDGELLGPRANLKVAQKIHAELATLFESEFGEAVDAYVAEFPRVAKAIATSWDDLDLAAKFTGVDRDMIDLLRSRAYEEFAGFGRTAQDRIAKELYNYVASMGSYADLLKTVRGILTGHVDVRGKPMTQYTDTWAVDSVMNFERTLSVSKAEAAGLGEYWLYSGSLVEDSRDFCIQRAERIFTTAEVERWNSLDWQGKAGDVWVYLGGYRCRHTLVSVDPSWFPDVPVDELAELPEK